MQIIYKVKEERMHVLVVEDDKGIADVLKTIFKIHQLPAYFAGNGKEALDIITNNRVALILCDFMLPDINGDKILDIIKQSETTKHIPFIFLSAFADAEDIQKGLQAGADAYITKPFSVTILMSTILEHLKPQQQI